MSGTFLIPEQEGLSHYMEDWQQPSFSLWEHDIDRFLDFAIGASVYDLIKPEQTAQLKEWYEKRIRAKRAANLILQKYFGMGTS